MAFEDPTRNYSVYSREGFYRHVKATVNKVDTYKEFGTGLTEAFLEKLDLDNQPSPEECEPKLRNEEESSDDEDEDDDYSNSNRDDSSVESFESESFLGRLKISDNNDKGTTINNKKPAPAIMTRKKDNRNASTETLPIKSFTTTSSTPPFLTPVLVECCGGNLSGTVPMLGGVEYEFYIADDLKSVVQKTFVPDECLDAKKMFYRHGLTDQHVTISGYQSDINKKKRTNVIQVNDKDKYFFETTLFSFPYEIESSFYDEDGNKVDTIFEGRGPNGLLWGYFYLKKKLAEEKKRTKARILRDNRRPPPEDDDFNNYGGGKFSKGFNGTGFQGNGNGGFFSQQMNSPFQNNNGPSSAGGGFGGVNQHFTSPNQMNNNGNGYFPNFSSGGTSNNRSNNYNNNDPNFMSPSKVQSPMWAQHSLGSNNGMGMYQHHHQQVPPSHNNDMFQSPTNQSFHPNNGMTNHQHSGYQQNGNNNITSPFGGFVHQNTPNNSGGTTPMMGNNTSGFKKEQVQQSSEEGFDGNMIMFGTNNQTSPPKIRIVRDPDEVIRLLGQRGPSIQNGNKESNHSKEHRSSPISLDTASSSKDELSF